MDSGERRDGASGGGVKRTEPKAVEAGGQATRHAASTSGQEPVSARHPHESSRSWASQRAKAPAWVDNVEPF